MKVLIACEHSQAVTKAFRKKGHEAYSCDLLPCSGDHPEWHIQGDCWRHLVSNEYGLIISFPPCTDLAVSGARWFDKKRLSGEQYSSILFFIAVYAHSNCVENPIGIMSGRGDYVKRWFPGLYKLADNCGIWRNRPQIIQPWQFGHGETKATCLWLRGLPELQATNVVEGREAKVHKMPHSANRSMLTGLTYSGIASAMADQWG